MASEAAAGGSAGEPTVYRYDPARDWRTDASTAFVSLLFVWLLLTISGLGSSEEISWSDLLFAAGFALVALLSLTKIAGIWPGKGWHVSLALDETELTYANGLTSRRWAWAELAAAEYRRWPDRQLRIAAKSIDWKAWLILDYIPLTAAEIRLPDVLGAPLPEICAKLNEHRSRALGDPTA